MRTRRLNRFFHARTLLLPDLARTNRTFFGAVTFLDTSVDPGPFLNRYARAFFDPRRLEQSVSGIDQAGDDEIMSRRADLLG